MKAYTSMTREELAREYKLALVAFDRCKEKKLSLNMARGKPSKMQLDAVSDIFQELTDASECIVDGVDVRDYTLNSLRDSIGFVLQKNVLFSGTITGLMYWIVSRSRLLLAAAQA